MTTQAILANMSTIDKATCLNLLRRVRFSATPLEGCSISAAVEGYSKENNMLIDSYLWRMYGLFYKDYLEMIGPFIGIDVVKLDKKIDRLIIYHLEELGKLN